MERKHSVTCSIRLRFCGRNREIDCCDKPRTGTNSLEVVQARDRRPNLRGRERGLNCAASSK
jgi:hypothetical protein